MKAVTARAALKTQSNMQGQERIPQAADPEAVPGSARELARRAAAHWLDRSAEHAWQVLAREVEAQLSRWESAQTCAQGASDADRLAASAAAACVAAVLEPGGSRASQHGANACALLRHVKDASARLEAAVLLVACTPWLREGCAQALITEFDTVVHDTLLPASARMAWCRLAASWHLHYGGDLAAVQRLLEMGASLASEADGLDDIRVMLRLSAGAAAQAHAHAAGSRCGLDGMALAAIAAGEVHAGIELAERASHGEHGVLLPAERSRFQVCVAALLAQVGGARHAGDWTQRAIASAHGADRLLAEEAARLLDVGLSQGGAAPGLAHAILSRRQRAGLPALFVVAPALAARIAALAYEQTDRPETLAVLIRRQGLKAPDKACAKWPWAIRVRALGALAIEIDGQPHASTGKAQQRLLELLRVLAAAGRAGRTQLALESGLWPDAESPKSALAVAVHRLRKLLGHDEAVIVRAGAVMLDPAVVWTDVDAFNHLCESVVRMHAETSATAVEQLADRLCGIYRGAVCQDDSDPWMVAVRARLCACFVTCATTLGDALEDHARWEAAGSLYRRVLEAEPLCETAYRGLMRCAHAQGDSAAAFSFYRFCRDTLSVILRREPCAQTRQLASELGLLTPAACDPAPPRATARAVAWASATTGPASRA